MKVAKESKSKTQAVKKKKKISQPNHEKKNAKKKTSAELQCRCSSQSHASSDNKTEEHRKRCEISGQEYHQFVQKTARKENVRPEELVTVERRANEEVFPKKLNEELSATASKLPKTENKERRTKAQRRRQIDPTTCERDYSPEEIEFMNALDEYKRNSGRMFPTCSEILEVFRGLGYIKQLREETIEVSSNPQSSDIFITSHETNILSRPDNAPPAIFSSNQTPYFL
ncbi:MAG: hypothetical protein LBJ67_05825 [Planctomycetaceae bacterium]|nr:hypothetical protein [Planctomycetaceae bacterium]